MRFSIQPYRPNVSAYMLFAFQINVIFITIDKTNDALKEKFVPTVLFWRVNVIFRYSCYRPFRFCASTGRPIRPTFQGTGRRLFRKPLFTGIFRVLVSPRFITFVL